jgi:hypothetical protein
VRLAQVGRTLVDRLGHPLSEEDLEMDELNRMREAYVRCARKAAPCHESLRFDFGADEPLDFERLLVPFSEEHGGPVSYVIGIAIYGGITANPRGGLADAGATLATPAYG